MKISSIHFALLVWMVCAVPAYALDVKGLSTGMKLDTVRRLMPQLQCKSWLGGPYEQMCDADNLKGNLSTLAENPLVSIRVLADKQDVVHVLNFSVQCGLTTEQLLATLQGKWGMPVQSDKLNGTFSWRSKKGELLQLTKANGKDNVCNMVSLQDAAASEWIKPRPYVPSKDL